MNTILRTGLACAIGAAALTSSFAAGSGTAQAVIKNHVSPSWGEGDAYSNPTEGQIRDKGSNGNCVEEKRKKANGNWVRSGFKDINGNSVSVISTCSNTNWKYFDWNGSNTHGLRLYNGDGRYATHCDTKKRCNSLGG